MAEKLNTLEINKTLKQLLSEVKGQKQELNSLKEEVRGTSVSVSSEVKKLKKEKELKWRFEGHKIQFVFNTELEDGLKQALWAYNNKKRDYLVELLNELLDKIKERNKFIRIADSSEGGWETVRQYESNPLASDSEDESRIRRAEAQAIRKKKTKRPSRYNKAMPFFPKLLVLSVLQRQQGHLPFYHRDEIQSYQRRWFISKCFRFSTESVFRVFVQGYNGVLSGSRGITFP